MPAPTPFDLNFRVFRIPVRVSPWFWLMAVLLGPNQPEVVVIWVPCVFFSILIHELGHGLTARSFGHRAEIALYGMGGLCASEPERETFGQRLAILFGGPGAQFLLLGALLAVGKLWLGIGLQGDIYLARSLFGLGSTQLIDEGQLEFAMAQAAHGWRPVVLFQSLFIINLFWPLLNLLPIFPLDGGQITRTIWTRLDYRHGARRTHILSMVTAGVLAAYAASRLSDSGNQNGIFRVIFFGMLAFMNYQLLQAYHQQYESFGSDEADWWKR